MRVENRKDTPTYRSQTNTAIKVATPALGLVGILISGYLTYVHYKNVTAICLFNIECDAVLSSQYSTMWGIPLSLFGLLMYLILIVLGLWSLQVKEELRGILDLGIYTIALSGTLFSLYLYYLEIIEIQAFCSWCIGSSVIIISILVLSLIDLFRGRAAVKRKSHRRRFKLSDYIQW